MKYLKKYAVVVLLFLISIQMSGSLNKPFDAVSFAQENGNPLNNLQQQIDQNKARLDLLENLLNQACPDGEFVTGIESSGVLICSGDTQEPPSPPPSPTGLIQLNFTAQITDAQGVFSGTFGTVTGSIIFDSPGEDTNADPDIGFYTTSLNSPYLAFSVEVPGFTPFESGTSLLQITNNNAILSGLDTIQFGSNFLEVNGGSEIRFDLSFVGPESTFDSDTIPPLEILGDPTNFYNPVLEVREGTGALLRAIVDLFSFSPVP